MRRLRPGVFTDYRGRVPHELPDCRGPLFARLSDSKRRDDFIISTVAPMAFLAYVTSRSFECNVAWAGAFYPVYRDATPRARQRVSPLAFAPADGVRARTDERGGPPRVIVAPSEIFSIDTRLDNGTTISFSDNDPKIIELGITRLDDPVSALLSRGAVTESNREFEIV